HQADDVVAAVDEAVVPVGHEGQAAGQVAHHDLGRAHQDVEAERRPEHAAHAGAHDLPRVLAGKRAHFMRAPWSSVEKIQPTTFPGWMIPSIPQNWRSRRKREDVSLAEMAPT